MKKNCYIILQFLLLVTITNNAMCDQNHIDLDSDSQCTVALGALKGAVVGAGLYSLIHWLRHNYTLANIKEHPFALAACATAGALIAGWWQYTHTPEKYFEYAQKGLFYIFNNDLLCAIVHNEEARIVPVLKELLFNEKLPLIRAFFELNQLYILLESFDASLDKVLVSHRFDLHEESNELKIVIGIYQSIIQDAFMQLRDDENFLAECNSATLVQIKDAQVLAAHAAYTNAVAPTV